MKVNRPEWYEGVKEAAKRAGVSHDPWLCLPGLPLLKRMAMISIASTLTPRPLPLLIHSDGLGDVRILHDAAEAVGVDPAIIKVIDIPALYDYYELPGASVQFSVRSGTPCPVPLYDIETIQGAALYAGCVGRDCTSYSSEGKPLFRGSRIAELHEGMRGLGGREEARRHYESVESSTQSWALGLIQNLMQPYVGLDYSRFDTVCHVSWVIAALGNRLPDVASCAEAVGYEMNIVKTLKGLRYL